MTSPPYLSCGTPCLHPLGPLTQCPHTQSSYTALSPRPFGICHYPGGFGMPSAILGSSVLNPPNIWSSLDSSQAPARPAEMQ